MHVTAAGAIDWAMQAGGKLSDSGYGIALVDGRDGVEGFLVSGTFSGEASIGSNTLNKSDSATAADGAASDAEKESARKARARIYTEFIAAVLKSPSKKAKTGGGGVAMSSAAGSAGSSSDPVSAVAAAGAAAAATDGMAAGGAAADGAEAPPMPRSFLYLNHDQIPPGSVPGDVINVFHVNGGPGMWITIPPHWIPGHGLRFQSTEPAPEEKDGKGS
eukprot:jgi/Chrpa1/24970/Chrysochromulina_OHIO_Genome00025768-RA